MLFGICPASLHLFISLTHFFLAADLPAAPVIFVFNWDVPLVQNLQCEL